MTKLNEVKERFYFSYSKIESDFLKDKGLFYITKAIHPQSKVCFTMWDRNDELLESLKEYNRVHKNVN